MILKYSLLFNKWSLAWCKQTPFKLCGFQQEAAVLSSAGPGLMFQLTIFLPTPSLGFWVPPNPEVPWACGMSELLRFPGASHWRVKATLGPVGGLSDPEGPLALTSLLCCQLVTQGHCPKLPGLTLQADVSRSTGVFSVMGSSMD